MKKVIGEEWEKEGNWEPKNSLYFVSTFLARIKHASVQKTKVPEKDIEILEIRFKFESHVLQLDKQKGCSI